MYATCIVVTRDAAYKQHILFIIFIIKSKKKFSQLADASINISLLFVGLCGISAVFQVIRVFPVNLGTVKNFFLVRIFEMFGWVLR